jgi:hypothetical protein
MERSSTNLHKYSNAPIELYDLKIELQEQNNLASDNPELVDAITKITERNIPSLMG